MIRSQVLVLGINYVPEKTGIGPFTAGLCEHLAQAGHNVKVITGFPYYPEWRVWDGYRGRIYKRERINNVSIRRVWHFVPWQASKLWQRLVHDLSFSVNAFLVGLFAGKCDVIYCYLPPPTLGLAAYLLSKVKRVPYVIDLEDMASDAALATGIMKEGIGIRLARWLEAFVYQRARSIVCLCQGFIDRLTERGVSSEKPILIPHWGDTENVRPLESSSRFRAEHGIPAEQFVILHAGNMGKKQKLVNVVEAAEVVKGEEGVVWLLVGDGEERPLLQQEIRIRSLQNVRLLPLQPSEMLPHMYAETDILVLNQKAAVRDEAAPAKLLTYMAAGRPIVAAADEHSEAARQVLRARCGLVVRPEDPQALGEAVLQLRRDLRLRQQLSANGRAYAEVHFTKSAVLEKYENFFAQTLKGDLEPVVHLTGTP